MSPKHTECQCVMETIMYLNYVFQRTHWNSQCVLETFEKWYVEMSLKHTERYYWSMCEVCGVCYGEIPYFLFFSLDFFSFFFLQYSQFFFICFSEEWSGTSPRPDLPISGIHVSPTSSPVPGVVPSASGIRSRTPHINSGWLWWSGGAIWPQVRVTQPLILL